MKRYNLVLPDDQFSELERVAAAQDGRGVAEVMRRALRLYVRVYDGSVKVYAVDPKDGREREAVLF